MISGKGKYGVVIGLFIMAVGGNLFASCGEPQMVRLSSLAGGATKIEWLGHSTFLITTSRGTQILTDPNYLNNALLAGLRPDIITVSHNHYPHENVGAVGGRPVVLRGLSPEGDGWNTVRTVIKDVSIVTLPAYHDDVKGGQRGKNAIFLFKFDELCIVHLGDLGHHLEEQQVREMGKVDLLLVPISRQYTIGPVEAREVVRQVAPRLAIPMHYWESALLEEFLDGEIPFRRAPGNNVVIAKEQLPARMEILVLTFP